MPFKIKPFIFYFNLLLTLITSGSVVVWLLFKEINPLISTIFLFIFVQYTGIYLCNKIKNKSEDNRLQYLTTLWNFKLFITIFILFAGWIPCLDPSSCPSWGYDPQRYYWDALDLIKNNWNPSIGANYQGIIFYYAFIFKSFGHNPVIPAIINCFTTLLGILYLISFLYKIKRKNETNAWVVVFLLLIPEVIWYDVMTNRDNLMATLLIITNISIGKYILDRKESILSTILISGLCLFSILAVRTTMILPVLLNVFLMSILLKTKEKFSLFKKSVFILIGITALLAGPIIQKISGGYDIDYLGSLNRSQSFESSVAGQSQWSNNSIGLLLAPNNSFQAILYMIPRMVIYLAAPLPKVSFPLNDLISGDWWSWQYIMIYPTSILMLCISPLLLAGTYNVFKNRKNNPSPLVLFSTFWIIFISVAGGNIIIHERYRLMFTILLFACAWYGYIHCTKNEILKFSVPWVIFLTSGVVFYLAYKMVA